MKVINGALQRRHDVVVVGSGAAALTAAATAANSGLRVAVLEKSHLVGGTSAVSGGMLWVVDNHYARSEGVQDRKSWGREYVENIARGRGRRELLDAAISFGDEMLQFVDQQLGLNFALLENFPDYRLDLPGAVEGGRTIEPELFDFRSALGSLADYLRSDGRHPYTMQEYEDWGAFTKFPWENLEARRVDGLAAKGHALTAMLLAACVRLQVTVAVEARADRLRTSQNRVVGVTLEDGTEIDARRGVFLGAGGFEWDHALADSMLASRLYTMCSPPSNEGDALRMSQRIGAMTRSTREAWWAPMSWTGGVRDGRRIGSLLRFERQGPGSIMVNRHGQRFANEAQNYNDLARCLQSWDSAHHQTLNTPAHVVFDHSYLKRYGILEHRVGQETPEWLIEAPTLEALAERISVPPHNLQQTVDRFNQMAVTGVDSDFGRGESAYDRYWGDSDNEWPNASLAPLQAGPFYALEVLNGAFGTCGGVATDGRGNVVDVDGAPIRGLYAAGNTAENPFATGYPGAGATLGPAMTMAYLAGSELAGSSSAADSADVMEDGVLA